MVKSNYLLKLHHNILIKTSLNIYQICLYIPYNLCNFPHNKGASITKNPRYTHRRPISGPPSDGMTVFSKFKSESKETLFKICIYCNGPCGDRPRAADSRVHWAIKVPERPSRLRLAGSLQYKQVTLVSIQDGPPLAKLKEAYIIYTI